MLVTLAEIVERAAGAGVGDADLLRYRFLHLQRLGLLGPAVAKAARRGGEGLWHPAQAELFLFHLRHLAMGVRRATLANAPVGMWLMGDDGVGLEQAQRALLVWAGKTLGQRTPAERRSLRRRGVLALADGVAHKSAGRPARRRLRNAVEAALDALPEVGQETFDAIRDALAATAPPEVARAAYPSLRLRLIAVGHIGLITSDDPSAIETWAWCRRVVAATRPISKDEQAEMLNAGCGIALQLWGMALEAQHRPWRSAALPRPPRLHTVHAVNASG